MRSLYYDKNLVQTTISLPVTYNKIAASQVHVWQYWIYTVCI